MYPTRNLYPESILKPYNSITKRQPSFKWKRSKQIFFQRNINGK